MRFNSSKNYTVLTSSGTASAFPTADLSPTTGNNQALCLFEVRGAAIYLTLDGSVPTSSNGFQVAVGERYEAKEYDNLRQLRWCSQSGTATIHAEFAS